MPAESQAEEPSPEREHEMTEAEWQELERDSIPFADAIALIEKTFGTAR